MKRVLFSILTILIVNSLYAGTHGRHPPYIGDDLTSRPCTGKPGGYGPFDYTERGKYPQELHLVEKAHFTVEVETLVKGNTTTLAYGDIAYTLRAWPNHHRALNAISRYHLRMKRRNKSLTTPAECWFQRAIVYNPKDSTVYLLYGIYLHKSKQFKAAHINYQKSLQLNPDNVQAHYNMGLLLVQLRKYDEAKKHAQTAYKNAFPLSGLRDKLKALGHWP